MSTLTQQPVRIIEALPAEEHVIFLDEQLEVNAENWDLFLDLSADTRCLTCHGEGRLMDHPCRPQCPNCGGTGETSCGEFLF